MWSKSHSIPRKLNVDMLRVVSIKVNSSSIASAPWLVVSTHKKICLFYVKSLRAFTYAGDTCICWEHVCISRVCGVSSWCACRACSSKLFKNLTCKMQRSHWSAVRNGVQNLDQRPCQIAPCSIERGRKKLISLLIRFWELRSTTYS